MTLGYYFLDEPIEFCEDFVEELVIEDQKTFRDFISMISDGISGYNTNIFLSNKKNSRLEISKYVELIHSPLYLDFKNKRIGNKLTDFLSFSAKDFEDRFYSVSKAINELGTDISLESDYHVSFTEILHLPQFIKMLGFEINSEDMTVNEKILEYMRICRNLVGKELFVFVNLKSFFNDSETEMLLKDMVAEKFNVLLLENICRKNAVEIVRQRIIDTDLCEIS